MGLAVNRGQTRIQRNLSYLYRLVRARFMVAILRVKRHLFFFIESGKLFFGTVKSFFKSSGLNQKLSSTYASLVPAARPVMLSSIVIAAAYLGHNVGMQAAAESRQVEAAASTSVETLLGSVGEMTPKISPGAAGPNSPPRAATTNSSPGAAATNSSPGATLDNLLARRTKASRRAEYNVALQAENRHLAHKLSSLNNQLLQLEQELLSVELELVDQNTAPDTVVYDLTNSAPNGEFTPQPTDIAAGQIVQSTWSNDPYNGAFNGPPDQEIYDSQVPVDYGTRDPRSLGAISGSNLPVLDGPGQTYDAYGNPTFDPSLQPNYTVDGYNSLPYQPASAEEAEYLSYDYVDGELTREAELTLEQRRNIMQQQSQPFLPAPNVPTDYNNTSPQ